MIGGQNNEDNRMPADTINFMGAFKLPNSSWASKK
jgi:hypothetical protein